MARKTESETGAQAPESASVSPPAAAIDWHRERAAMGVNLQRYALALAEAGDVKTGALCLNAAIRISRAKAGKAC